MQICLVTTTINVPSVLELYAEYARTVGAKIVVAGDEKTPHGIFSFCADRGIDYLSPADQQGMGYKCSDLIGWNVVARRNIAYLAAVKEHKAEVIVTIDDDNIPLDQNYFLDFSRLFLYPFAGLAMGEHGGWFDAGRLQYPQDGIDPVVQRGMPQTVWPSTAATHVINKKIGLAQGVILGDPDTSAIDRISRHPNVHTVSQLLQSGVVVTPGCWTPVNTQNTAFRAELLPAMLLCPQFGRYDDIFASLIAQHVMSAHGMAVHHGRPFVYQERKRSDWFKDLAAEQWGAEHVEQFVKFLGGIPLKMGVPIVDQVRYIHNQLGMCKWWPEGVNELALAWADDCEKVMK